jgi:hypothetical protein
MSWAWAKSVEIANAQSRIILRFMDREIIVFMLIGWMVFTGLFL